METDHYNQLIIITGASGAGRTTAINVFDSALELSNYFDNTYTLSRSDGSEIIMNQSSKLSLSGYSFDTTSSSDVINVYETEI